MLFVFCFNGLAKTINQDKSCINVLTKKPVDGRGACGSVITYRNRRPDMDLTKIDKPFGELDRETKIALFAAWVDGAKIEYDGRSLDYPVWHPSKTYRVAATKPSIDWSHVAPQFKWMATDVDGMTYIYSSNPRLSANQWVGDFTGCGLASLLASFIPGTCDWKDSLVQRPEVV